MKKVLIAIICVVTAAVLAVCGSGIAARHLYPLKFSREVEKYSELYGVDKYLLCAVIRTESGFDPDAESQAGAIGLTQITEPTFEWLCLKSGESGEFEDLYNPGVSIKYGAYFLSLLLDEFSDTSTALAAYHAGRGRVNSWLADSAYSENGRLVSIPSKDTAHYVSKVEKAYEKYLNIYSAKEK